MTRSGDGRSKGIRPSAGQLHCGRTDSRPTGDVAHRPALVPVRVNTSRDALKRNVLISELECDSPSHQLAGGCLSIIRLSQPSSCQRSLVEVRPTIPECTLVESVGLCVRSGLPGASNPWRSPAMRQILRGLMVVQVPSREYAPAFRPDL
jgi:hypothetical protein